MACSKPACILTAENEKNYRKLQELFKRGHHEVLLIFFHKFFPKDPKKLYKFLKNHEKAIIKLSNKNILNKNQLQLIFPTGGQETFSNKFDPSIIKVLIANFGNTGRSLKFWTSNELPPASDQSEMAHVKRIFVFRNLLSHLPPGYASNIFYNKYAPLLINALVAFGANNKSFLNILPPIQFNLSKPISNFFGRDDDIQRIHDIVTQGNANILRVVVHGLAGVGKTETLRKYCDNYGEHFERNILWINSTNQTSLENDFKTIASILKLNIKDCNGNYESMNFIIDSVHQHLRSDSILYVFDDASDIETVMPFLPKYQPSCSIITSQLADWPYDFKKHQLKPLNKNEIITFLNERLNPIQLNAAQISTILPLLEGHPLAIQQFVAAISNTMLSIEEYINNFKLDTAKLLSSGLPTIDGNKSTVSQIKININKLLQKQNSSLAYEIINTISYLYNENISIDVLNILFPDNIADRENAIKMLSTFSLINIKDKKLNVHSLIQKTLKLEHGTQQNGDQYLKNCVKKFNNQLNVDEEVYNHSNFAEKWYEEFLFFIDLNISHPSIHDLIISQAEAIFEMLKNKGRIERLIKIFQKIKEHSTLSNEQTLKVMYWTGCCYLEIGKCSLAIELYQKSISESLKIYDENHPDVLTSMSDLASCYRDIGKLDEAIKLHKETLEKRKSLLGENHQDTLSSMNNLALCYRRKGKLEEAIKLHKETLEKRKSLRGENHQHTLSSMNNLALCYQEKGKLEEAIELNKETIEKMKSLLGENHQHTLSSMNNLASCYQEKGKLDEAIELIKETLEKMKSLLGENHRNTLLSMNNLALCYQEKGKLDEAIELYKETLEKRKSLLGENHQDTLSSMNNLALCYREKGKLDKAIELNKETLEITKSLLGENHPDTLGLMNNLALCYRQKGKLDEAIELNKETLEKRKSLLGENHQYTLASMNNLASCYKEKGNLNAAIKLLQEANSIAIKSLSEDHWLRKMIANNLRTFTKSKSTCFIM